MLISLATLAAGSRSEFTFEPYPEKSRVQAVTLEVKLLVSRTKYASNHIVKFFKNIIICKRAS